MNFADTWEMMPQVEKDGFLARHDMHKMLCANGEHDWKQFWRPNDPSFKASLEACQWCRAERGRK